MKFLSTYVVSEATRSYLIGCTIQNFPGGACPQTPLALACLRTHPRVTPILTLLYYLTPPFKNPESAPALFRPLSTNHVQPHPTRDQNILGFPLLTRELNLKYCARGRAWVRWTVAPYLQTLFDETHLNLSGE